MRHFLRILVGADVPPDPNSGAAGTVVHTNEALRALGHEVDEIWAENLGRRVAHGNLHYLLELPRRYAKVVADRCSRKEYDVIQLSQPHAWLAARDHQRPGRSGVFVNRSHGLELMAEAAVSEGHRRAGIRENRFPRSVVTLFLRRLLNRSTPRVARHSDGLIVPAEDIRTFLMDNMNVRPDNVRVIHHGVVERFVDEQPTAFTIERTRRLLYVGQYAFIKGPHILAAVVNEALRTHHDATMTWVCAARDHAAAAALIEHEVAPRVRFLDWRSNEELIDVLDDHGIFLFPSLYEGAGKACLEAMTRGLVVVSSDVGAMRDYITHGEDGYLCPVRDVAAFVNVVNDVLVNHEIAAAVSPRARKRACEFTWQRCAEEATGYYEQLLAAKRIREARSA